MRGNENNLVQNQNRTPNERRDAARKAGVASGAARRRKKTLKQCTKMILDMQVSINDREARQRLAKMGISEEEMTYAASVASALILEAESGSMSAVQTLMDLTGERASDENKKAELKIRREELRLRQQELSARSDSPLGDDGATEEIQIYMPQKDPVLLPDDPVEENPDENH